MKKSSTSTAVQRFDEFPNDALLSITDAGTIAGRSRASIYRHFKSGELTLIKVGSSTRIRVADLRKLIGATA